MKLTFFSFFLLLLLSRISAFETPPLEVTSSLFPSDAVSLLSFKSAADLDNKLLYSLTERFDYCQWRGVKCAQGRVVRLVLNGAGLRGEVVPNSLSRLDQLRVLSLDYNSLSGSLPDLSSLINLKSLFLSGNSFSGTFPLSILSLHRLMVLDLSYNNFSGPIPVEIISLDRLNSLKLEFNRFSGTIPALNQSYLIFLNVSSNNLTGPVPVTPTLSRFGASSFRLNPGLCGEIIDRACPSHAPFFGSPKSSSASSSQAPLGQSAQAENGGGVVVLPPVAPVKKRIKGGGLVMAFTIGVTVMIALGLCLVVFSLAKKRRRENEKDEDDNINSESKLKASASVQIHSPQRRNFSASNLNFEAQKQDQKEDNKIQLSEQPIRVPRSGNLVFCGGVLDQATYSLEQLMRASAELLGRGSVGTTYKAVLDNQLIVTVKRLDATKTAATSGEAFEQHMEMVGGLRHPNLVTVRAYFQAKGERLVIYDYEPNGSLFNLIHGSRSSRAKPLHWTSCLKIAEDVAQGLSYIHQTSTLIHGNLKSTNILLGPDFEACLTDYCLNILSDASISTEDPDSSAYRAPETRKSSLGATAKSDVYSFGVFLFELMTGRQPSQHPFMAPQDMLDWVKAMREEDEGTEDSRLGMLTEVACVCRVTSPEQRPAMRQVMKMIQEIKETVVAEESDAFGYS